MCESASAALISTGNLFLSGRVAEDFPDRGQADAVLTVSYMRQLQFTGPSCLNSRTDRFVFMSFQQDEDSLGKW